MYLKLAWRNIWRNKRRTVITLASIFFAVLLALAMRSMQLGSYSVTWHADDDIGRKLGQGVYFCRMKAGDFIRTRKLLLLKGGIQ